MEEIFFCSVWIARLQPLESVSPGWIGSSQHTGWWCRGQLKNFCYLHKLTENLCFLYLLVTWGDESSPPLRRVADTSRHLCGWPSSYCLIFFCPCGSVHVLVSFLLLISHTGPFLVALLSHYSILFLVSVPAWKTPCWAPFWNCLASGFIFSTTQTLCFLISVRAF